MLGQTEIGCSQIQRYVVCSPCLLFCLFVIFYLGVVDTWGEGGGSYGSPQWEVVTLLNNDFELTAATIENTLLNNDFERTPTQNNSGDWLPGSLLDSCCYNPRQRNAGGS